MAHHTQECWAIGCVCRLCRRPNALFRQSVCSLDGTLAGARLPIVGAFAFRCTACGANNTTTTGELRRVCIDQSNAAEAA